MRCSNSTVFGPTSPQQADIQSAGSDSSQLLDRPRHDSVVIRSRQALRDAFFFGSGSANPWRSHIAGVPPAAKWAFRRARFADFIESTFSHFVVFIRFLCFTLTRPNVV